MKKEVVRFKNPRFATMRDAASCAAYFQAQTGEEFGAFQEGKAWYVIVIPGPELDLEAVGEAIVDFAQGMEAAYRAVVQDQKVAVMRSMN